jgi:oxygen-dependent protoporphyrinogen oxidase
MEQQSAGCGVEHFLQASQGEKSTYLRNLRGGSSRLPEALGRELGERVLTGASVHEVTDEGEHLRVAFRSGDAESIVLARHVVLAAPADVAARIAPGLDPETRDALEAVPYGPFVVVSLLTNERSPMPWDELYAVVFVGKSFNLFTNQANILRDASQARRPGGSLMLYASGDFARPFLEEGNDRIVQRFLDDAASVFPQLRGIVSEALVQRWPRGVPYVAPGRYKLQAALERHHSRISLAGDYFDYASMEGAAVSGVDAAQRARGTLARAGAAAQSGSVTAQF